MVGRTKREGETYPVTVGVVEGLQFDNVRVSHNPHDLQFTVLMMGLVVGFGEDVDPTGEGGEG